MIDVLKISTNSLKADTEFSYQRYYYFTVRVGLEVVGALQLLS